MQSLAGIGSLAALHRPLGRLLVAFLVAVSLTGCGLLHTNEDETVGWSAGRLYSAAKDAQADSNWDQAAKYLEKLEARYPYGRFAQQAQMELGYVYWKAGEPGSALAACDRFIKLHPNHPAVDYVMYLKGLVNFNEDLGITGYISTQDPTERDPKAAREAFEAFRDLAARFPESKYTPDAVKRMNYLVHALAALEIHVARYYMRRGAYVAAANRAQTALTTYPNAPDIEEALVVMVEAYDKLGMTELRDDARRVLKTNYPDSRIARTGWEKTKPWWQLW